MHVGGLGGLVGYGGEAGEAVFVDVHAEGGDAVDVHIDTQIELKPVNQQRLSQISLHHHKRYLSRKIVLLSLPNNRCQRFVPIILLHVSKRLLR